MSRLAEAVLFGAARPTRPPKGTRPPPKPPVPPFGLPAWPGGIVFGDAPLAPTLRKGASAEERRQHAAEVQAFTALWNWLVDLAAQEAELVDRVSRVQFALHYGLRDLPDRPDDRVGEWAERRAEALTSLASTLAELAAELAP